MLKFGSYTIPLPTFIMHPDDESLPVDVNLFLKYCNVTSTSMPNGNLTPLTDGFKEKPDLRHAKIYYNITQLSDMVYEVKFYLFYMWQGQMFYCKPLERVWRKFKEIGTHIGDWEDVTIVYIKDRVHSIHLSQHGDRKEVSQKIKCTNQNSPIIYISRNAHAMYTRTFWRNTSMDKTKCGEVLHSQEGLFEQLPEFVANYSGEWGNSVSDKMLGIKYKGGSPRFKL